MGGGFPAGSHAPRSFPWAEPCSVLFSSPDEKQLRAFIFEWLIRSVPDNALAYCPFAWSTLENALAHHFPCLLSVEYDVGILIVRNPSALAAYQPCIAAIGQSAHAAVARYSVARYSVAVSAVGRHAPLFGALRSPRLAVWQFCAQGPCER